MELHMYGSMERIQQWLTGHRVSLVSELSVSIHLWASRSLGAALTRHLRMSCSDKPDGNVEGRGTGRKGEHVTCYDVSKLGPSLQVSTFWAWASPSAS